MTTIRETTVTPYTLQIRMITLPNSVLGYTSPYPTMIFYGYLFALTRCHSENGFPAADQVIGVVHITEFSAERSLRNSNCVTEY